MTREETYDRIDAIIAKHEIDDEYVTVTNEKDYDALRLCRKVIEQEPFMNKPCVAHKVCHEDKVKVLEKIRVEIQGLRNCSCSNSDGIIDDVEDILDKYKAESEK